jgi:hypothetical protein
VFEYKHISLYNVLQKVVAKVLANSNKLKNLLPSIYYLLFIGRRLISDNMLLGGLPLYVMDAQMIKRREEHMTIKLDVSKT